jgi:hypothetical protein
MAVNYTVIQAVRQRFGAYEKGGPPADVAVFGNARAKGGKR